MLRVTFPTSLERSVYSLNSPTVRTGVNFDLSPLVSGCPGPAETQSSWSAGGSQ